MKSKYNIQTEYDDELDSLTSSLPKNGMSFKDRMIAYHTSEATALRVAFEPKRQKLPKEDYRLERNERKRKVNERLKRIHLPDEQRSLHFVRKQKEYDVEVMEILMELEEWYDDFLTFEGRTPNEHEFSNKATEVTEELKVLDSRINPDFFFKNGPNDVVLCGRILIKNKPNWDIEDEQKAVCLFSALQWLLRKRAETFSISPVFNENDDTISQDICKSENEELVQVFMQLHLGDEDQQLTINNNVFKRGKILTAVMHMYQDDKKTWAANPSKFSKKIISCLPDTKTLSAKEQEKKVKAMAKCINREIADIKGVHLKDLSVEKIVEKTGCFRNAAKEVYIQWEGLYPYVLLCRDNIRGQRPDTDETEQRHERDRVET